MSKLMVSIGLGLVLVSTAANAAPTATQAEKAAGDATQYGINFADDTGSHLTRTECRTKKEWKRLGVDVDNPSGN